MAAPVASVSVQPALTQTGTDTDAWKDKWVYLGVALGGGRYTYHNYLGANLSGVAFAAGFLADFSLAKFFSLEAMLGIGYGEAITPVLPLMAKFGWQFSKIELSADAQATPSAWDLQLAALSALK